MNDNWQVQMVHEPNFLCLELVHEHFHEYLIHE